MMAYDDKAEKNRNKKARRLDQRLNADMLDVMRTTQGKSVMMELLSMSKLSDKANTNDPNVVMRFEGRRDLGRELYDWIMVAAPGSYMKAMNDNAVAQNVKDEFKTDDEKGDDDAD